MTTKKTTEPAEQPKLRIKIRAYDHRVIDQCTKIIIEAAERIGAELCGPVPLPRDVRKYTVNRSTFVHKNARDQYEVRTHKRLIDILNPSQKIVETLSNLNLPSGVDIEIKMI
jgi:small subunit ribosomal protein S10